MKVLVAMSGGVDSSVAAALLVEQGHEVVGVTMKLWGGESDTGCCSVSDVDDARRVAQQLGIPHHVWTFTDDFDRRVVEPYVEAHRTGVTPNPCIECNRHLKFDRMLGRARSVGFDTVATGHHARITVRPDGTRRLARGADRAKDQVRAEADRLGLRTASKPDSQDVCFITSGAGRAGFLGRRLDLHPATVVDAGGAALGAVDAVELVTVGQRRGLGLPGGSEPRYVTAVDVPRRKVVVGPARDLEVTEVRLRSLVWPGGGGPVTGPVLAQCSAHGVPRPGSVEVVGAGADDGDGEVVVRFDRPERRVAAGQSVVLYDPVGDHVVGGGLVA